ncbi:MAG: elongation factor Ts [Anaerolineae bacterium]|nr:elongation factor Ts [Anaerolineae bacterium]
MVKDLRQGTGAGFLECKKMLVETDGDMERAAEMLYERGMAKAAKKVGRDANDGLVGYYIHPGSRVAGLVEVNCETDFVARTPQFQEFVHDMAMHVVAAKPRFLSIEDIPGDVLEREKAEYRKEAVDSGKPERILDRIVEGKLLKFYETTCLLEQPFIKDDDKTVAALLSEMIAALGENIVLRRFVRFEVGE